MKRQVLLIAMAAIVIPSFAVGDDVEYLQSGANIEIFGDRVTVPERHWTDFVFKGKCTIKKFKTVVCFNTGLNQCYKIGQASGGAHHFAWGGWCVEP